MFLHVVEAKHLRDYVIWVRFNNGAEGEVDLEPELTGEVFGELRAPETFMKFHVDNELDTIVWENGADLAPEFLFKNLHVAA